MRRSEEGSLSDDGGGNTGLTVTVESSQANSLAGAFNGAGGLPLSPSVPVNLCNASDSGSNYSIGFPLSAVAPSGAAPVGLGFVGLNVLGADCVVKSILWP